MTVTANELRPPEGDGYQFASLPLGDNIPLTLAQCASSGWEFLGVDPAPRLPHYHPVHSEPQRIDPTLGVMERDGVVRQRIDPTQGGAEPYGLFRRDTSKWTPIGQPVIQQESPAPADDRDQRIDATLGRLGLLIDKLIEQAPQSMTFSTAGMVTTLSRPSKPMATSRGTDMFSKMRSLVSRFYGEVAGVGALDLMPFVELMNKFLRRYSPTMDSPAAARLFLEVILEEANDPRSGIIARILAERSHQSKKGYTPEHDMRVNTGGELVDGAIAYLLAPTVDDGAVPDPWPEGWDERIFHNEGRISNIAKAVGMLVAELERLETVQAADPLPAEEKAEVPDVDDA